MRPNRALAPLALALGAALGVAGYLAVSAIAQQTAVTGCAATRHTVALCRTKLGSVLVDSRGHTLYLFRKDRGRSACYRRCAAVWPPLLEHGKPTLGPGVEKALLGTTKRGNGTVQLTYNKHPLYTYRLDRRAGRTNGEGLNAFGARWYAVSRTGLAVKRTTSTGGGTVRANGLHVSGNRFVNNKGKTVRMQGVHGAFAWGCSHDGGLGTSISQSAANALLSWHVNVERIGLPEDCWLGINGLPLGMTAAEYRQDIKRWIDLLHRKGIYTEVSLMYAAPGTLPSVGQAEMPDQDHAPAFWTSVARYLKDEPDTFFGLYGEPHPPSAGEDAWSCWLQGGSFCRTVAYDGIQYRAVGMQHLVDTIRATGATQPIAVSGINSATNLSAWLAARPNDPEHQLVAEYHQYPGDEKCWIAGDLPVANNSTCWDKTFAPIIRKVPLWNGEAGEFAHSDTCSWTHLPPWLAWMNAHGGSYAVFKWAPGTSTNPCGNMSLIEDYRGTPSPTYGQGYRRWLAQNRPRR